MGGPGEFSVSVDSSDDRLVVHVEGELDMASVEPFEQALTGDLTHVVVDLGACTFLDSSGLRAIASAARRADHLAIVTTDPGVLRVVEIAGLDAVVSIHPSLESAP